MKTSVIPFVLFAVTLFGCNKYQLSGNVTVDNKCKGNVPESVLMNVKLHYEDSTNSPDTWVEDVKLNPNGTYSFKTGTTNIKAKHWEIDIAVPCDYITCEMGSECADNTTRERNWNIIPVTKDDETKDISFDCGCK